MTESPTIVLASPDGLSLSLDERHLRVRGLPTRYTTNMAKRAFADGAIELSDKTMEGRSVTFEGWVIGDDHTDCQDRLGALIQMLRKDDVDLLVGGNLRMRLSALERVDPAFIQGSRMRSARISLEVNCEDPAVYWYDRRLVWQFDHSGLWSEGLANIYAQSGHVVTIRESSSGTVNTVAKAAAVDEGTTNLLSDNQASIETSAAGWTATSGATPTRITTDAHHQAACLEVATAGAGPDEGVYAEVNPGGSSANKAYTGSVYVKAVGATVSLKAWMRDQTNGVNGSSTPKTITPAQGWVRVSAKITIGGVASSALRLNVTTDGTAAVTFRLDAAQIEQRGFATSFTLGTRAAGALVYDLSTLPVETPPEEFIFFGRFSPAINWDDSTTPNGSASPLKEVLITWGAASTRGFELAVDRDAGEIVLTLWPGESLSWAYSPLSLDAPLGIAVVMDDTGAVRLYADAVLRDSYAGGGSFVPPEMTDLFNVGSSAGAPPNHRINEMLLSFSAADEVDIMEWDDVGIQAEGAQAYSFDLAGAESTPVQFTITVPLYGMVWPVMVITNKSQPNLDLAVTNTSDGDRQFSYRDSGFVANLVLTVDSQYGTVMRGVTDGVRWAAGPFPRLVAGENVLEYQGKDANVTFLFTPRWQ